MADMRDHDRGGGGGDAGHAVMLRHPVAVITERFGVRGEIGGIGQRLRDGAAFGDGDEVEKGVTGHVVEVGTAAAGR